MSSQQPLKQRVTFGKFANIDMRVATVISAPMAEGSRYPSRYLTLDAGHLGSFRSVGQYALIAEEDLVGKKLVICCNLAPRQMGDYESEVLVLGTLHPETPSDQEQAVPLYADERSSNGDVVF